jgi:CheY-like chemotaxis protein
LLVEDEEAVRRSTVEFLQLSGYIVLQASDGNDALQVAREYTGSIDLMITDVVMPRVGGTKLAEQLATERPDMKVLFVSGYAESTVLRHGPIDIVTRFLQKPFSLKSLAQKIRKVLESKVLEPREASAAASGASG